MKMLSVACVAICTLATSSSVHFDDTLDVRGTTDLKTTPERIVMSGRLPKFKTHDKRVLGGSHFLTNLSGNEYRIVSMSYALDTKEIRTGEWVKTDIGMSILPEGQFNALNSGEEMLMTHQYDAAPSNYGFTRVEIPKGGFRLKPMARLNIGSTSGVHAPSRGALELPDSRTAPGRFMNLNYRVELVRADLMQAYAASTSYRSPYRDRLVVMDANRRIAPFTDFKNTSVRPVELSGIGIFISTLSSSETTHHAVSISINGQQLRQIRLPAHIPGKSAKAVPLILPLDVTLRPGDVVSAKGIITGNNPLIFDFGAFLIGDEGLTPLGERLDLVKVDLNGDGYDDIIDIDRNGSVWVALRVGTGLQDTQQEWARGFRGIETVEVKDIDNDGKPDLIGRNKNGLCVQLKAAPQEIRFLPGYCGARIEPHTPLRQWGDFNGDGFPDRMRIDPAAKIYYVALGSKSGLGKETQWVLGSGAVDRMFVYDGNGDGKDDILAEWSECAVWRSNGTKFVRQTCD